MSNKLVKEFPKIAQPNEQVILDLKFTNTGKCQLQSVLPPAEVCKILVNLAIDVMFNSFEMKEVSTIQQPPPGLKV